MARAMAIGFPATTGTHNGASQLCLASLNLGYRISYRHSPAFCRSSRVSSSPQRKHRERLSTAALDADHTGSPTSRTTDGSPKPKPPKSFRDKATDFMQKQAGYLWLVGPVVATSAVVLPTLSLSLVDVLQRNYWMGLGAIFALDLMYVLAADAFFVLSDKCGHQQSLPGGTPPWIAPWELLGFPKGLPHVWDVTIYAGIGAASLALILSVFVGKVGIALAAFAPYLALIFVQSAYERLLCKDRLPTYPLVPIVYTMYRFRQLGRAMELFAAFGVGPVLVVIVRLMMAAWTFYLATYLAQLPWLYCTWNSNKIS